MTKLEELLNDLKNSIEEREERIKNNREAWSNAGSRNHSYFEPGTLEDFILNNEYSNL